MRSMPRNPFQDRINALNMKDLEEGLKTDSFLKKSHGPIPNDINDKVFPYTDIKRVDTLKPEELSMKDLLDQIQIQTILNNNIAPYVKKEIKSEVTQEMIKDFQNESAKPVEINGTLYKFKPPDVNISLQPVPGPFPDEATYRADVNARATPIVEKIRNIENLRVKIGNGQMNLIDDRNAGRVGEDEFRMRNAHFDEVLRQLDEAQGENEVIIEGLRKEFFGYEEARLQHVADVERITKENKKNIANYADEIKSRNSGFELPQQEGESDADYAQRMIDTAHTVVDPNQALIQAQLYLYNTMKDRLSEMIQPYKAEGVLNQIVKVDGYEGLQVMKDRWPSLKKGLTDTFGDLRRVDNTDSIAIFLLENSPVNAKAPTPVTGAPSAPSRSAPASFPSVPSRSSSSVVPFGPLEPTFRYTRTPAPASQMPLYTTPTYRPPPIPASALRSGSSSAMVTRRTSKDRSDLEPLSVIKDMNTADLRRYLESKGISGPKGGLPSKASKDSLLKMYLASATPELRASGLKPLDAKGQFEIINGEIEAGNNNPQLLRDARKLLKEFVQKKMVTIYEAKTHMKHLRKVNKI